MSESREGRASGNARPSNYVALEDCADAARAVRLGRAWRRTTKREPNERTRSRGLVRMGVAGREGGVVSGLRDVEGRLETHPEEWPSLILKHDRRKFEATEPLEEQRYRLQRWETRALCDLMDVCATEPSLEFEDYRVAKCRLTLRKTPGRDGVPADMLSTWGPVADATVYGLCIGRLTGRGGHMDRSPGWSV